jgi:hypothetical protein
MAQRMTMPPAEAYPYYTMPSEYPHDPEDTLIDVVEGSDSDYDHQLGRKADSKNRKKHVAPIQTTFHCWMLTKAASKTRDDVPNWKRAERVQMTLSSDELGSQVKKQLKARSLTEMYEALSTDQRQQVEVLLKEKRRDETNKCACWEIAAIHREVRNNMRTRVRETTFIRVILSREDKRKVESPATERKTTKASVASNISDLNDLSDLLLKPEETSDDQYSHTRKKEYKARPKVRKGSSQDVIEVMSVPNIDNAFAINVPPMVIPPPMDQSRPFSTRSNQALFWQLPSGDHRHEDNAQHRPNQWRPRQAPIPQQHEQLDHVHHALVHITNANSNVRTEGAGKFYEITPPQPISREPWFPQQSPPVPPAFEYTSRDGSTQHHLGGATTYGASPHYEARPTNSEQDYFGRQIEKPYEMVTEPFFAKQPQHAHNIVPAMSPSHYPEDPQARRASPRAKIEVSGDSDWPDYDPTMDQPPLPTPPTQQHNKHGNQGAERSRREDVLFWRTQAQLSHSRSVSSLDDQSSTLASPEQSSPLTSVSGDGIGMNRMWTNEPEIRYTERDEPIPGRFGQQLAAHSFLRPNQDKQQKQPPMPPRRSQSDYKPPTNRNVSFRDEPFEIPDLQPPLPYNRPTHNSSIYTPEPYTRPSAPDPPEPKANLGSHHPEPKANFGSYNPQRYQPRQLVEVENSSMLERLSERLDHMELRQAETATRRAVEAAQKRREAERKEAYERGIEDAMAWKARSGGFGGYE